MAGGPQARLLALWLWTHSFPVRSPAAYLAFVTLFLVCWKKFAALLLDTWAPALHGTLRSQLSVALCLLCD